MGQGYQSGQVQPEPGGFPLETQRLVEGVGPVVGVVLVGDDLHLPAAGGPGVVEHPLDEEAADAPPAVRFRSPWTAGRT